MCMGMGFLRLVYIRSTMSLTKQGHVRLNLRWPDYTSLVKDIYVRHSDFLVEER
jgi:hypothetical protein